MATTRGAFVFTFVGPLVASAGWDEIWLCVSVETSTVTQPACLQTIDSLTCRYMLALSLCVCLYPPLGSGISVQVEV
jgi:hypothetical protein